MLVTYLQSNSDARDSSIDQFHQSHNAPIPYPTNSNVHISVLNGASRDMEQVYCGICELVQLGHVT